MSNAIAQSATQLTSSTSFDNWDYMASVRRVAARKLPDNGLTVQSVTMAYSALTSASAREIRNTFPTLFAKRDDKGNIIEGQEGRLPQNVYDKVCEAVNQFISELIQSEYINHPDQLVRNSVRAVHQSKKHEIIERHTLIRDEIIPVERKITHILAFISETERQLAKYNKQQSPFSEQTEERVKKLEARLKSQNETWEVLKQQRANLKGLEKTVK